MPIFLNRVTAAIALFSMALLSSCSKHEDEPRTRERQLALDTASAQTLRIDPESLANFGRVTDARPFADGGWAILDATAPRILIVDSASTARAVFGRAGDGPGDLRRPFALSVCRGNMLAVFQPGVVSVFDRNGRFRRSIGAPPAVRSQSTPVAIDDACEETWWFDAGAFPDSLVGRVAQPMRLIRVSRDSGSTVLRFPGLERFAVSGSGRKLYQRPWSVAPSAYWSDGSGIVVGAGGDSLWRFSKLGATSITADLVGPEVTAGEEASYDSTRVAWIADEPRYETVLADRSSLGNFAKRRASVANALISSAGDVWLRPYPTASDGLDLRGLPRGLEDQQWLVLGADGSTRNAISIPRTMVPVWIGRKEMLVISTDSDGSERLRLVPFAR
jgi:hypothetical protein